tara:strand:+ start:418 stop:882 length:465 start_codon:yes stop_codon:yes gene_type:complete
MVGPVAYVRADAHKPESAAAAALRNVLGVMHVDPGEQSSQALLLVAVVSVASVAGLGLYVWSRRRSAAAAGARLATTAPVPGERVPRNLRRLRGKHTHAQLSMMDDDADDDATARPSRRSQPQTQLSTKERFRALAADGKPARGTCTADDNIEL